MPGERAHVGATGCLLAVALLVAGCRSDGKPGAGGGADASTRASIASPEAHWEWDEAKYALIPSGASELEAARPYIPIILAALQRDCAHAFGYGTGEHSLFLQLRSASGADIRAYGAGYAVPCVKGAAGRMVFPTTPPPLTFRLKLVVPAVAGTPDGGAAPNGAVATFSIGRDVKLPKRPRVSKCSPGQGTYRIETLKAQHVGIDTKVDIKDFRPAMVFEVEGSYTNTSTDDCFANIFNALAEDGRPLAGAGPVILFTIERGEQTHTNDAHYAVDPGAKRRFVFRYAAPEGVRRVLLGINEDAGDGRTPWLMLDLEDGKNELTIAKRPPLVLLPTASAPPGPAPPPVPGASWTFPTADQTEPAQRDASGSTYPAERVEPHLVAPDGTTFVERWFPARIQCLDGATGRVRWEHPMPALVDDLGRPVAPSLGAMRMRLVTARGDLLLFEPRDTDPPMLTMLSGVDGATRWKRPVQKRYELPALVDGGPDTVYAFTTDTLVAHAAATGEPRWRRPAGTCPPPPPDAGRHAVDSETAGFSLVRGNAERVLVGRSCASPERHTVLAMLGAAKGQQLWERDAEERVAVVWLEGGVFLAGESKYRELDPATGAERSQTSSDVDLPHHAIPPMLEAIGPAGVRYFVVIDSSDVEKGGPTSYFAVDGRSGRVLEKLAAMPTGPTVQSFRHEGGLMEARERTPLADGKSAIVRDLQYARIARVRAE
jgi:outer membrane protein assembly factor BamB